MKTTLPPSVDEQTAEDYFRSIAQDILMTTGGTNNAIRVLDYLHRRHELDSTGRMVLAKELYPYVKKAV